MAANDGHLSSFSSLLFSSLLFPCEYEAAAQGMKRIRFCDRE
jgi:hypothetical protein